MFEMDAVVRKMKKSEGARDDAEAVGLATARYFGWDGLQILRAAQYALEDANFHTEAGEVSDMADAVEAEDSEYALEDAEARVAGAQPGEEAGG
jgi:hypothetical protein